MSGLDAILGSISDYIKAEKVLDIKVREYDLYHYTSTHDQYLLVADDGAVMGEFSLAEDAEHDGAIYEHTAFIARPARGQGLYFDFLKAIHKLTGKDIISYPFDPDSDQERSEMNNRFWAKHGIEINNEDGPIYRLNYECC